MLCGALWLSDIYFRHKGITTKVQASEYIVDFILLER
jgi:hypothetical protein